MVYLYLLCIARGLGHCYTLVSFGGRSENPLLNTAMGKSSLKSKHTAGLGHNACQFTWIAHSGLHLTWSVPPMVVCFLQMPAIHDAFHRSPGIDPHHARDFPHRTMPAALPPWRPELQLVPNIPSKHLSSLGLSFAGLVQKQDLVPT